ncbi:MAG: hypothetical protein V2I25_03190 [Woeseiaceae bacterium]|nr:hypothetical protein [Woeseiaceae bacterium]
MTTIHSLLVYTHILFGAAALVLFWVPVVAKKGSPLHRRAGRYYATAMYIVAVSAFVACLLVLADPIGMREPDLDVAGAKAAELARQFRMGALFLLMLSVLVFTSVRHGLLALREKREAGILRTPLHRGMIVTLGMLGLGVGGLGVAEGLILLMIFGGVGLVAATGMFRETLPERLTRSERTIAHLGGLIGSGIGAYTAFFAFGGARFLGGLLPGQWQALAWIVAPVIGTVAINVLNRRYRSAGAAATGATSPQAG